MIGTEERTYWQEGDGNCLAGGCSGYDSVWTSDGVITGQAVTRPPTAVTITDVEHATLMLALAADAEVLITQQNDALEATQAAQVILVASARANLVAGTPLTEDEATAILG